MNTFQLDYCPFLSTASKIGLPILMLSYDKLTILWCRKRQYIKFIPDIRVRQNIDMWPPNVGLRNLISAPGIATLRTSMFVRRLCKQLPYRQDQFHSHHRTEKVGYACWRCALRKPHTTDWLRVNEKILVWIKYVTKILTSCDHLMPCLFHHMVTRLPLFFKNF